MTHAIWRHTANYVAALVLLFGAAFGLDQLLVHVGRPPIFGCFLRPVLYLILSRTIAVWMMSLGLLMLLFVRTRPTGTTLLIAGLIIGILPGLLEIYLAPLCTVR